MKAALCLLLTSFASIHANKLTSFETIPDHTSIQILNPALADRVTAKIRLSNGIEAYLISDPGSEQSAASVTVEAGSWDDPKEYPGMAHFLEHMLFMGNKAYPKEFEYMQFVADHGGSTNAFTASDRTAYMFSINNDSFEAGLDRFANFFIEPLFLPSCINRELHAVDQEHSKNIENDDWRQYMILKETGNPLHPNAGFSTGNAQTLSGIPQEAMKSWYRDHYSANRMHLVVLSSLPIDQLVSLVVDKFSAVPNYNLPKPAYPSQVFSQQQMGSIIYIKPVRDIRSLTLLWQVPKEFATDLDHKQFSLLTYALQDGSEHSLAQQLKREKLSESMMVGIDELSLDSMLFLIKIDLTEEGVAQINRVSESVFQALARFRQDGVPRYLFDEMKKMRTINYQYQSRSEAFQFIMQHAANIINEPLETYPEKSLIPTSYNSQLFNAFLDTLTPQSCLFMMTADPNITQVAVTKKEAWMNAEYELQPLSKETLTAWKELKPTSNIMIPPQNSYIPSDLTLLAAPAQTPSTPLLLSQDATGKIYFLQDTEYKVPEVYTIFHIKTPALNGSAKADALHDLYLYALSEKLFTPIRSAQRAGLQFFAYQQELMLSLGCRGLSEKTPLFLKTIFQNLQHVQPTAEQFEIYKQALLSEYDNQQKNLPAQQASDILSSILYNDAPTSDAKYRALKNISYEEFSIFAKNIFKKATIDGLIYGNISQPQATAMWNNLKESLNFSPPAPFELTKKTVLTLPDKQGPYLIAENTNRQGHGAVLLLQEGPFSFEKRAAQQLLSIALKSAFFDTLRTKQQTAYIAKTWDIEVEMQLAQGFVVQSNSHHPRELLARFDLFLEEFNRNIETEIPENRFNTIRTNLIERLAQPPENLSMKGSFLDMLITKYSGDFQWIEKRIATTNALSYADFINISRSFLARTNLKRLAILMEGNVPSETAFSYELVSQDNIRGVGKHVSAR